MYITILRKRISILLTVLIVLASVSFGQVTVNAETQQGELGSQHPAIVAVYTDDEGNTYDGNALTPGSYTMTLSVSDLYSIADLQFTAYYDEAVLSFSLFGETLLSDTLPDTDSYVMSRTGGEFTFFVNSINNMAVLPGNGADLISIGITVKGDVPVDMQNVLDVNEDPNFTYICVNYDDSIGNTYNCYAISDSETYPGTIYPMTCDLSPNLTQYYTVSAYVGALASPNDTYGSYATTGAIVTISTENGEISSTTDDAGRFTLENVPNGTYVATISYKYGFDRTFTIEVSGADIVSDTMIGIVGCNWDETNMDITATDMAVYAMHINENSSSEGFDVGIDIDRSGDITALDMAIYDQFSNMTASEINYVDIEITA